MSSPLVSIIIPLFNRQDLVRETLDSVLAQTYPHWECIVVDDGSTDDSVAVVSEYAARDARFKIFERHRGPKGAPTCRNIGLEKAEGEYVIFFDSDDFMMSYCLENRIGYFSRNPHLDLLISYQKRVVDGEETFLVNTANAIHPIIRFFTMYPNWDIPWVNNSTTVRRKFLQENNIQWCETFRLFQDIQYNVELLVHNPTFLWPSTRHDSLWIYSETGDNIGKRFGKHPSDIVKLLDFFGTKTRKNKLPLSVRNALKQQYRYLLYSKYKDTFRSNASGDFNDYFGVLKSSGLFKPLTLFLIRTMFGIEQRKRRYYIHRLIRRKIEQYYKKLEKKIKPMTTNESFLRIKELDFERMYPIYNNR